MAFDANYPSSCRSIESATGLKLWIMQRGESAGLRVSPGFAKQNIRVRWIGSRCTIQNKWTKGSDVKLNFLLYQIGRESVFFFYNFFFFFLPMFIEVYNLSLWSDLFGSVIPSLKVGWIFLFPATYLKHHLIF